MTNKILLEALKCLPEDAELFIVTDGCDGCTESEVYDVIYDKKYNRIDLINDVESRRRNGAY